MKEMPLLLFILIGVAVSTVMLSGYGLFTLALKSNQKHPTKVNYYTIKFFEAVNVFFKEFFS